MLIKDRIEKREVDWNDRIPYRYKFRYKMICKRCNKNLGYCKTSTGWIYCSSCQQTGKISGKRGKKLSIETKKRISESNLKWRTAQNPNYRKMTAIDYKLAKTLRIHLSLALKVKSLKKQFSYSKALGCSIPELRMHIDHIKPISLFDLSDSEQFNQACHYTNLQPMWCDENWSKGSKYDR